MLGLSALADADEVRAAYRNLVKTCHPDKFLDADERKAAQEKMIALNRAYEEALRLASHRRGTNYNAGLCLVDALSMADKMLRQQHPQSAMHHLMRTSERDDAWYAKQGEVYMAMQQYESAHNAFREAIRRNPNNNDYRQGALDAALAMKKEATFSGRLRKMFHKK